MSRDVKTGDFVFRCDNEIEVRRAKTLFTKEEGTVAWLRESVRPGDCVYDVGANIGLYTVLAASLVGHKGVVYAFEPHVGNAHHLMRNVRLNKLPGQVIVVTAALHDECGFKSFNYFSKEPGSSGSQFGHTTDEAQKPFVPVGVELKYAATLDALAAARDVVEPDVVKIDVDGNELQILYGMSRLLAGSPVAPRTVQVEVRPRDRTEIVAFMADRGFGPIVWHHTANGKAAIAKGADPTSLTQNVVFRPVKPPAEKATTFAVSVHPADLE